MAENKEIIPEKEFEIESEIYNDDSKTNQEEKFVLKGGLENNPDLETQEIFDDILYPDNEKRERRACELQDDIKLYVNNLIEKGEMLNSIFENLKQKLDLIEDELNFSELKEEITIPIYQEYNFSISKIIKYVFDIEVFSKVTNHAYKFILMKRKDVKIPFDNFGFSWTSEVFERIQTISLGLDGGFGLFDLMIGAISGTMKRNKLQKFIWECLQPRIELKHDVMVLDLLIFEFQGFIGGLDYIRTRKLTKEELREIFKLSEQRCVEKVKEINYSKAKEILKQIDEQRGSWKNKEIIYENESEYVGDTKIKEKFVLKGGLEDVETMMGVFEPIFYPDNQNRLKRVNKLANDIRTFSVELVDKKDKLDFELGRLKEILEKIGNDLKFFKLKEEITVPIYEEYNFTIPIVIKYIIESLIVLKQMFFELVTDEIKALVNGLNYVRTRNPTKEEIENMFEEIKVRCDEKIKEIDDGNKVNEALEKLDKGRESWVVEN
ncbi:11897_t:CDS:2 [Dentiscutata erythropus]|uniref:11897_t:CDS:1 n=1 Tax=Dentiscutata erythropus TaxID=1348616 RepID=A0A9N9CFE5_9GLOM|nr:11897_t:CDS:2 [Dentiscutata erythropus]